MNIETAEKIARQLHEGQFRADGVTPYIEHPKAVAELVKEYGGSEKCVCVAWLHDIMEENAEGTRKLLGLDRIDSKARFIIDMRGREDWKGILFDLVKIEKKCDGVARSFSDYQVTIGENTYSGVSIAEMI
jgi:hypothetical protein